ncbi:MAG: hypothetical protein HOC71_08240 [Candidatus Latescibacteria bacterium]|nr:hypothetical protein [Candidatus Latescibacterota bacterium]
MNDRRVFHVPGTGQYHDEFGQIVEQHEIPQNVVINDEYRYNRDYNGEYISFFKGIVGTGYILIKLFLWILQFLVFALGISLILVIICIDLIVLLLEKKPLKTRVDFEHFLLELKDFCIALPDAVYRKIRG